MQWFRGRRIPNPNTHGTGCTLSSAIAANLAKGFSLDQSVRRAKEYISGALGAMPVSYTHLDVYKRQHLDLAGPPLL